MSNEGGDLSRSEGDPEDPTGIRGDASSDRPSRMLICSVQLLLLVTGFVMGAIFGSGMSNDSLLSLALAATSPTIPNTPRLRSNSVAVSTPAPVSVTAPPAAAAAAPTNNNSSASSSSSSNTGGAPLTPLVHPKTITVTFVSDWTQAEMQSPLRPVTVSVVLGPAGTLPQHSQFCFEFLLFCEETSSGAQSSTTTTPDGEAFAVPKGERALLWHVDAPYPRFEHSVVRSGCRLSSGDELKTISLALRTHADEKHPNALVYVRRNGKIPKSDSNTGYLKVVRRHHYYLNITFATSSTIAQLVGLYAWRPMIYLTSKKVDPTTGRDTITGSRVFTHFNTNWAQGVEHNPSEGEQKAAAESIAADTKVEETLRAQSQQRQTTLTPGSAGYVLFSPTPSASIVPLHPLAVPIGEAGSLGVGMGGQLTLRTGSNAAPQPQASLNASHLAYAPPPYSTTSAISPFPPAPPGPMPAGMLRLSGHPPPSNMALAQSMMAQLSVSATPSQAQQHQHEVLRAMYQQQQAQLLTQYQLQYQNQQRALQQYQQLQAHQLSLPSTQQQQLQVQTVHRPTLTQQQLDLLAQPHANAIASSQIALPALVPGTHALQLSAISTNPSALHVSDAYRYHLLQQQSTMLQLTTIGQQRTQAYQHAMGPISGNGMTTAVLNSLQPNAHAASGATDTKSSKPVTDFPELETEIKTKALHYVNLPPLEDSKSQSRFVSEISFDPAVSIFSQQSVMSKALAAIEFEARMLSLDTKHEASDAARHMLSCLSAVNQLVGWQHVSWYIRDPVTYLEKSKDTQKAVSSAAFGTTIIAGSMDDYQQRGQALLKRLAGRIDWLLMLQRRANKPFDASFAVKVIAADRVWAHDANVFMREAESKVTELLVSNQSRFQEFREQQRKGVGWPHSVELRKTIESAGFVYRPMMIKRDRCVCETCGVEVSGWRSWHNPWSFHNYSRHDDTFRPPRYWLAAADPSAVSAAVTEANLRGNQTAASAGAGAATASDTREGARPAVVSATPRASAAASATNGGDS